MDKELLIERIRLTDDQYLLLDIQALLDEAPNESYSEEEFAVAREEILLGRADIQAGRLVPHEVVMKALQERGTLD